MAPHHDVDSRAPTAIRGSASFRTRSSVDLNGLAAGGVYPTSRQACGAAAEFVADRLRHSVALRGAGSLALSGGATAGAFFAALAAIAARVPWAKVSVFWVDERFVPPDHPDSNFGLARRLLLDRLRQAPAAVVPFPTTGVSPAEAARSYSAELRTRLGDRGFDVVVLGIGADGHTASLFPSAAALDATARGADAYRPPHLGTWRLSLTLAELNAAAEACFVALGEGKARAVALAQSDRSPVPAGWVRPAGRPPRWFLDAAAAARGYEARRSENGNPMPIKTSKVPYTDIVPYTEATVANRPAPNIGGAIAGAESEGGAVLSPAEVLKRRAAEAALAEVRSGMTVGLGTGSTARFVVEGLAARLADGRLIDIVGVPTSLATSLLATRLGLKTRSLAEVEHIDLAIDGTDEITSSLDLIKGMGGALVRERLVAMAADRFVVVADASKVVSRLGTKAPVPLAVIPFGAARVVAELARQGIRSAIRGQASGAPVQTDDGLLIVDATFDHGIESPFAAEAWLRSLPGVVDTGLFLGLATAAYLADGAGITLLEENTNVLSSA